MKLMCILVLSQLVFFCWTLFDKLLISTYSEYLQLVLLAHLGYHSKDKLWMLQYSVFREQIFL